MECSLWVTQNQNWGASLNGLPILGPIRATYVVIGMESQSLLRTAKALTQPDKQPTQSWVEFPREKQWLLLIKCSPLSLHPWRETRGPSATKVTTWTEKEETFSAVIRVTRPLHARKESDLLSPSGSDEPGGCGTLIYHRCQRKGTVSLAHLSHRFYKTQTATKSQWSGLWVRIWLFERWRAILIDVLEYQLHSCLQRRLKEPRAISSY